MESDELIILFGVVIGIINRRDIRTLKVLTTSIALKKTE